MGCSLLTPAWQVVELGFELGSASPVDFQTRSAPGAVHSLGVPPAGSAHSVSKVSSSWDARAQPCSWEEAASSGSASREGGPCSALISWEDPKPLRAPVC